jgi:hypothetical protein
MKNKKILTNLPALAFLTVSVALALAAQDEYTVSVPGALGFAGPASCRPVGKILIRIDQCSREILTRAAVR